MQVSFQIYITYRKIRLERRLSIKYCACSAGSNAHVGHVSKFLYSNFFKRLVIDCTIFCFTHVSRIL